VLFRSHFYFYFKTVRFYCKRGRQLEIAGVVCGKREGNSINRHYFQLKINAIL
jgi:hypothetical protein